MAHKENQKAFNLEKLAEKSQDDSLLKEQHLSEQMIQKNLKRTPLGEKMTIPTKGLLTLAIVGTLFCSLVSFSGRSISYALKHPVDAIVQVFK